MGLGFCIIGIMMIIWKELQSSLIECIVKLMIFVAELFDEYSWSHVTAHRSCYMIMFPYKVINVCNIMNIHDLMPQFTQQVLLIWRYVLLRILIYCRLFMLPWSLYHTKQNQELYHCHFFSCAYGHNIQESENQLYSIKFWKACHLVRLTPV